MLDGLDDDQRAAATAPRGPVCVLAGAGTGKTRTITHRIAHLVRTGHVAPGQVLAVTFTARAAGEMRTRLRALGVAGVQARTFHAAALRQLRYFWPRVVGGPQWQLVDGQAAHRRPRGGPGADGHRRRHAARPGGRDRVGEGQPRRPRGVPGRGGPAAPRRARARRAGGGRLRGLRGGQDRRRAARLRRPPAARRGRPRGARRHRAGVPRPLPLLRRRRVPGRHPAAAAGARRVARRARRPHRRRRRQPDDLHVRRARARSTCWSSRGASPRPSSSGCSATTAPPRRSSGAPTRSSARPATGPRAPGCG